MRVFFEEVTNSVKNLLVEYNIAALNGSEESKIFLRDFWYQVKMLEKQPHGRSLKVAGYKLNFYVLEQNTVIFTDYSKG